MGILYIPVSEGLMIAMILDVLPLIPPDFLANLTSKRCIYI
jgi:hypothetical protein